MVRRTSHLLVCRILYKSYWNAQTTALVLPSVSNDQVVLVIDHWRSRALHVHRGIKALPNIRSISEYKASLSLTFPSMVRDTYLVMFHTALFVPVDWTGCSKSWYRSRAASWFSDPWRNGDRGTCRSYILGYRLCISGHCFYVCYVYTLYDFSDSWSSPVTWGAYLVHLGGFGLGLWHALLDDIGRAFMARERVWFYVVLYW